MTPDVLIFDIDGVLIDTSRSFSSAVTEAVRIATDSSLFMPSDYQRIKEVPGFNNDWLTGCAGFLWIWNYTELSINDYCQRLAENGGGLPALQKLSVQEDSAHFENVIRLCQESYGGKRSCRRLYGFEPATIQHGGQWQTEQSLLPSAIFNQLNVPFMIFTGRDKTETGLAMEILGWNLPSEKILFSDQPELDKPNPVKLIQAFVNNNYQNGYYFGDSIDDYNTVQNFNRASDFELDFILISNVSVQQTFLSVDAPAIQTGVQTRMSELRTPTFTTITQALTKLELLP